jgi:ADP-ribose pyrophosphatase YjhB (NUDIX family)
MWKRLSSKVILKHPRITLIEDKVKLPTGEKTTYLKFNEIRAATLICLKGKKILLQKEYSYPPNKILLEFPGGAISLNKSARQEANRELMEETGLKAGRLKLLGKYLMNNRRSRTLMYVYLATNLIKKSLPGDLEENTEQFWFTEGEIDKFIKNGKFENAYSLAAWSLYKVHKRSS